MQLNEFIKYILTTQDTRSTALGTLKSAIQNSPKLVVEIINNVKSLHTFNLSFSFFYAYRADTPIIKDDIPRTSEDKFNPRETKYNVRVPVKMLKELISLGLNPNTPDVDRETPLMAAIQAFDIPLIDYLISLGVDPTPRDKDGNSALSLAEDDGDPTLIAKLKAYHSSFRSR